MESRPAIVENSFSKGVATEDAIVSGLVPAKDANFNGGEINIRQVAHREQTIRHYAENKNSDHHQSGHDRMGNKYLGKVHISL